MDSSWVLVFDARRDWSPGLLFPLAGIVAVLIGVLLVRMKQFSRDANGEAVIRRGSRGRWAFLIAAVLWTVVTAISIIGGQLSLNRALAAQRYQRVEGKVEDFVPADFLRKKPERWTVNGRRYELDYARLQLGLSSPGAVKPGQYVRIADVDGAIARLEVQR